jgi:hypothetical protein
MVEPVMVMGRMTCTGEVVWARVLALSSAAMAQAMRVLLNLMKLFQSKLKMCSQVGKQKRRQQAHLGLPSMAQSMLRKVAAARVATV